ncbi:farnesyl-diphosphate synthase [Candidatus Gracilibacteria bacterium]|nr:MAG: farnesyl-diphosphate synthase [Candidatus Gracilibacteria bacterium]
MLPSWYLKRKSYIEKEMNRYLDAYFSRYNNKNNSYLNDFSKAVFYGIDGGKKLRSILALEFYLTLTGKRFKDIEKSKNTPDIIKFCLAIEFVHAYSLIHDDLPCMDNDTLRRGKPTVWKKFGEYQAVLVGDMLNSLSFEIISEIKDPVIGLKLSNLLGKSVGFHGMIGGQVDDMFFEQNPEKVSVSELIKLHNKKTGALIKASVQGGILLSDKLKNLHKLSAFGEKLGLAFQIKDDLLDVEGDNISTGKSVGGENKGFVYFYGIKQTRDYLDNLIDDCFTITRILKSRHLHFLVGYVKDRHS